MLFGVMIVVLLHIKFLLCTSIKLKYKIRMTVRWSAVAAKIKKERAKQKEHKIMVSTIHIPSTNKLHGLLPDEEFRRIQSDRVQTLGRRGT